MNWCTNWKRYGLSSRDRAKGNKGRGRGGDCQAGGKGVTWACGS